MHTKDENWSISVKLSDTQLEKVVIYGQSKNWSESGFRKTLCILETSIKGKVFQAEATDYFEAFANLRNLFQKEQIIPLCYGADLNTYPSGMARDMGKGLKAYHYKKGKHAKREDLVHIFESGEGIQVSTVEEQKQNFLNWVKSERT